MLKGYWKTRFWYYSMYKYLCSSRQAVRQAFNVWQTDKGYQKAGLGRFLVYLKCKYKQVKGVEKHGFAVP
jgi:hypothetical protein